MDSPPRTPLCLDKLDITRKAPIVGTKRKAPDDTFKVPAKPKRPRVMRCIEYDLPDYTVVQITMPCTIGPKPQPIDTSLYNGFTSHELVEHYWTRFIALIHLNKDFVEAQRITHDEFQEYLTSTHPVCIAFRDALNFFYPKEEVKPEEDKTDDVTDADFADIVASGSEPTVKTEKVDPEYQQ